MIGCGRLGWSGLVRRAACVALVAAAAGMVPAHAQDPKGKPSNPVGGWNNTKVTGEASVSGVTLDARQLEIVKAVSNYFNELQNLKGTFVQTNSERQRLRGKFYVKRPGRLRFEYALPSKQLIVADGQFLAIQDLDIGTDDRLSLDQTAFRLLLRKDVDLLRDARILEAQEADDLLIVALQDKNPEASGRIRLFMTKSPALEIKEWVTTDAQGLDTRVEVTNLVKSEEIDPGLFKITAPAVNNSSKN